MAEFLVIEKKPSGEKMALGSHQFEVAPRIGEVVSFDGEKGIGQAYRVIAVMHPLDPVSGSAGDLYIEHIGPEVAFRNQL